MISKEFMVRIVRQMSLSSRVRSDARYFIAYDMEIKHVMSLCPIITLAKFLFKLEILVLAHSCLEAEKSAMPTVSVFSP